MVTDGEYEDEINSTVLAGESNITLAELEVITDYEDVEVEELEFSIAGDFSSTFEEVRMVLSDGSSYTAESTVFDGTDTIVLFEDIVFMESDNATVDGKIVADIASYSTEGDAVVVNLSADEVILQTQAANGDGEFDNFVGAESNEELTVVNQTALTAGNGDITNIVPVLVTAVVAQEFDDEEEDAIVTFVVDYGNNDLDDNDVVISTIEFDSAAAVTALSDAANGAEIENENDEVTFTGAGAVITITDEGEISNGDQFTFTVDTQVDGTVVEIIEGGIEFTVDGNTYVVESDNNDLDLGRYTTDNDN